MTARRPARRRPAPRSGSRIPAPARSRTGGCWGRRRRAARAPPRRPAPNKEHEGRENGDGVMRRATVMGTTTLGVGAPASTGCHRAENRLHETATLDSQGAGSAETRAAREHNVFAVWPRRALRRMTGNAGYRMARSASSAIGSRRRHGSLWADWLPGILLAPRGERPSSNKRFDPARRRMAEG